MSTDTTVNMREAILERLQAISGVKERIEKAQREFTRVISGNANNEFTLHWCARGNMQNGLFASIADTDGVLEFGLLERVEGQAPRNIIHVSCTVDDDTVGLLATSDENSELNYSATITPDRRKSLNTALEFFESYF